MIVHANKYFKQSATSAIPTENEKERILYLMEKEYRPVRWRLPDDFDSREAFDRAVRRLDMTSSPGFPYMREASTNGQWLCWNGVCCDPIRLDRLWYDVQRVFDGSFEQFIRVFIKSEPHKSVKAEEGRWRLIMACSLPVQMVWHMLFDYMNDLEIEKAYEIPSQQGLVLVNGGWKLFRKSWIEQGYDSGLDKSAWDWTAPSWALDLDLEFRRRMGYGDRIAEWHRFARYMYDEMFVRPRLILSDGSVWLQTIPGIMKSGCVNTISSNSHMQVMIHVVACDSSEMPVYPLPRAVGDDTLQCQSQTTDLEAYRRYGVVVKTASEGLEFVGHEFTRDGPHPLYMFKHVKRLQYTTDEILPQYLDSMARMYVHTEHYWIWERLAIRFGCPLSMSRDAYLYWYDVGE